VVRDLVRLRDQVLERWGQEGAQDAMNDIRRFHEAVDVILESAVRRCSAMRDRLIRFLDRLSELKMADADDVSSYQALLQAFVEAVPNVDRAWLLLADGQCLRPSAATGIEERSPTEPMSIGEGIAGMALIRGAPLLLPRRKFGSFASPAERGYLHGLRTTCCIPLVEEGEVVGALHLGTIRHASAGPGEMGFLCTLAARATRIIRCRAKQRGPREELPALTRPAPERQPDDETLESIVEQVPVAIALLGAPLGRVLYSNKKARELWGDASTNDNADQARWHQLRRPDGRAYDLDELPMMRSLMTGAAIEDEEVILSTPEGREAVLVVWSSPVRDRDDLIRSALVTAWDVTARKNVERVQWFLLTASGALTETLDHEAALDRFLDVVVPEFADWCVIETVTEEGLQLLGARHRESNLTSAVRDLWRHELPSEGQIGHASDARPKALLVTDISLRTLAHDPEHFRLLTEVGMHSRMSVPLFVDHHTLGRLTFVRCDSRTKYQESDLQVACEIGRRAAVCLDHARLYREAKTAARVRGDILSIVAHDLRNPLSAARMSLTMFRRIGARSRTRRYLDVMERALADADRLASDLVDLASIQSGHLRIEKEPCDLAKIIAEALESVEAAARVKGIRLDTRMSGDMVTVCDRGRILQVLWNLLGNAIKFCTRGGNVVVSANNEGKLIRVRVSDTGRGIPPADLPYLFDLYWSGTSRDTAGRGLGLYISKGIVESHGGTIEVESLVGHGTTFHVTLPRSGAPTDRPLHRSHTSAVSQRMAQLESGATSEVSPAESAPAHLHLIKTVA
jgi:signal transduction histidine kinase/PAS domain-containing protein